MAEQIVNMILGRIARDLTMALITNVNSSDPTRVSEVKIGRFQEDPSAKPLRVFVQHGNLEDPKFGDGIADPDDDDNRNAFVVPPREIGGGEMWWRRGTVVLEMFFLMTTSSPSEATARTRANVVLGRAVKAMKSIYVADLQDTDFDENAIKLFCTHQNLIQGGGPPNSYLFRGTLVWEVLTERPND